MAEMLKVKFRNASTYSSSMLSYVKKPEIPVKRPLDLSDDSSEDSDKDDAQPPVKVLRTETGVAASNRNSTATQSGVASSTNTYTSKATESTEDTSSTTRTSA